MSTQYEIIEEINHNCFLEVLEKQEDQVKQQRECDGAALCLIKRHERKYGQKYYRVRLTEEGTHRLVLPAHNHGNKQIGYPEAFYHVVSKYTSDQTGVCYERRIAGMVNLITETFNQTGKPFMQELLPFVSSHSWLGIQMCKNSIPGLHTGCFHRFVAYGVWVKINGHLYSDCPLEVYYCDVPSTFQPE